MRENAQVKRRRATVARNQAKLAAAREIGDLTDRELVIAGALNYWCEGTKDKAYRRCEEVNFINSDPSVIALLLRFLEAIGIEQSRIRYRVHIHETADVDAATRYWADLTCAAPESSTAQHQAPQTHNKTDPQQVGRTWAMVTMAAWR